MRRTLLAVLALAAALLAGALVLRHHGAAASPPAYLGSRPPAGVSLPSFALHDQGGRLVSSDGLRGRVVVASFLDTACTEACPVVAGAIDSALARLTPAERGRVVPLAITVDPAADTPAHVRRFLQLHRSRLRYLTGTRAELRPVWRAFYVQPVLNGQDDVHSDEVRIYDAGGTWVSGLNPGLDLTAASLAHDVRVALR